MNRNTSVRRRRPWCCVHSCILLWAITNAQGQGIAVPSYFYPGALWTQLADGAPTASLAIINPNSGPGVSSDPNYVTATNSTRAAGVRVIGYVYTSYSARSAAAVQADIDQYYNWYAVDGIFLDEVDTACVNEPYYAALNTYIKSKGGLGLTVLNPGTFPSECYMAAGDIICTYEDAYSSYGSLSSPAWVTNYLPCRFWHIIYNVTSGNVSSVIALARSRNAGYVYVTDDTGANPYDTLPSYWNAELNAADPTFVPVRLSAYGAE